MIYFNRFLCTILVTLFLFPEFAWSQAKPSNVNRAVSGTVQQAMITRGFAANDPRYGNTLARMTPSLTAIAGGGAAVVVGTITAPAWATALAAIVVSAAVSYAVNVGLNALTDWLFRTDGKIDQYGEPTTTDELPPLLPNQPAWKSQLFKTSTTWDVIWGADGQALAYESDASYRRVSGLSPRTSDPSQCTYTKNANGTFIEKIACGPVATAYYYANGTNASCPKGQYWVAGNCSAYGFISGNAVPTANALSPQAAISNLPSSDLDKKLNPEIIAKIANAAWKNAASQPGYDGVPYQVSKPITTAEAQTWMTNNPTYAPTVRDFVYPNPVTAQDATPWALPLNPTDAVTTPATTPNAGSTNPSTQPQQNLGADPNIGAPTLEQTPTAQMILDPVLNLMPSLKNFSPSVSSGTCPRPSFTIFSKAYVLESHCTLFDEHRSTISAAMILAFSILALFIVLSA